VIEWKVRQLIMSVNDPPGWTSMTDPGGGEDLPSGMRGKGEEKRGEDIS